MKPFSFYAFAVCLVAIIGASLPSPAGEGSRLAELHASEAGMDSPQPRKKEELEVSAKAKMTLNCGGGVTLEVVRIPAGTFMMGSPPEGEEADIVRQIKGLYRKGSYGEYDETERGTTISKPFYLGIYEVTQAQYRAVMGTNPSRFRGDALPVEQASWEDAMEFCRKLSSKTGRKVRLPTEAEWEYACRAGTATMYCIGNNPENLARVGNVADAELKKAEPTWPALSASDGYGETTAPAGRFQPNAWGLYDMHGNVYEWCSDGFGNYDRRDTIDPQGASSGIYRVARGGSWRDGPWGCRSACRGGGGPGARSDTLGFRVALDN